mmetsp:Transcript_40718/g.53413  ORF Transcript_40718/g.53413 Transcript_40718/m.53413 type:complete len:81 (-) Transcript_40718:948-1190(-)
MNGLLAQLDEGPSREKTVEYLKSLRKEFLAEVAAGKSPEELAESMGERVFKKGVKTMGGAAITLRSTAVTASVVTSAAGA